MKLRKGKGAYSTLTDINITGESVKVKQRNSQGRSLRVLNWHNLIVMPVILHPALWDLMNCSTPGFPALYYLPEFAQTHVHWISDAVQSSHPLLPSSPLVLNLSQHQCLFQWVGSSHQVAKVLPLQLQYQSSQWIFKGWFPLGVTGLISLLSNGLSRVFYTTVLGPHLKNGLSLEKTSYVSSMKQE